MVPLLDSLSELFARRPRALLFLVLFGAGLAVFSGRLETSDEQLMAATSHALAWRGSLRFAEMYGQTFTGYGIGTPLAGVPLAWIEGIVRPAGWSLLPLANLLLFAWLGMLAAGVLRRIDGETTGTNGKPECLTSIVLLASPLLPASATFGSEMLTAVGLVGLAWSMAQGATGRGVRLALAGAVGFAAAAVLARLAILPVAALVVVWGWTMGVPRRRLAGAGIGLALAVVARGVQNAVLRGSPFAQGYDGQEFVTPLLTGLHGLLLAPERGILVFFPLLPLAMLVLRPYGQAARSYRLLAGGVLIFTLVFHARFWTWHGGWSPGPRFLLPAIALGMPVAAGALGQLGNLRRMERWALGAAFFWGLWGAVLYSLFSPVAWWQEIWRFHEVESRWQFEPQLSLWANWYVVLQDGAWKPVWLRWAYGLSERAFGAGNAALHTAGYLIAMSCVIFLFGHWAKKGGTWDRRWTALVGVLVVIAASGAFRGPRGWAVDGEDGKHHEDLTYLRLRDDAAVRRVSALLDLRPHGTYWLYGKAAGGTYRLAVDGSPLVEQTEALDRHIFRGVLGVKQSCLRLAEVEYDPAGGGEHYFHLYWTWPGEGTVLQPVGGEYVLPRELTAVERAATFVWRRKGIVLAGVLALLLLLWREKASEGPERG
ncbi:MAG: hypothetical protein PWP23_790 [Candidatus Sumerlaeota bacterium]|nr:hypothetical protein [Candidatus Sumerlaeota bacterium]